MVLGRKTIVKLTFVLLMGGSLLAQAQVSSPPRYQVKMTTTKGDIIIAVTRAWAPHAADRFYTLVRDHYFDNSRFFRVVAGRWAQFGIAGKPAVAHAWRTRTFPDDSPPFQKNLRGTIAFAFAVPNGRTTELYINLRDNIPQDSQGFAPFGEITSGMEVADQLNSSYGEKSGGGIRAGHQDALFEGGNRYLDSHFPALDKILKVRIVK
jgi:cyclophilin family peptidyl-prolyl cis-trans isomerase